MTSEEKKNIENIKTKLIQILPKFKSLKKSD